MGLELMRSEKRIRPFLQYIEEQWERNPDLRFGQLLINLGIVEDGREWNKEMIDYPFPHKVAREIFTWGKYTGSIPFKGILIDTRKDIFIKDLEASHIKNILKTQKHIKGTRMESLLKEELKFRKRKK